MKKMFVLIVAIGIIFALGACNSTNGPENAVKSGLDAVKSLDEGTVQQMFGEDLMSTSSNGKDALSDESQKIIFSGLTYKISKTEENGSEATVTTEITNKNFKSAMTDYLKEGMTLSFENAFKDESEQLSEEELQEKTNKILLEKLKAVNETITNTVNIKLKKDDNDKWVIQTDEKLIDALVGGMVSAANDLSSSFTQ